MSCEIEQPTSIGPSRQSCSLAKLDRAIINQRLIREANRPRLTHGSGERGGHVGRRAPEAMDALRFMRGAAPPQPPVAPASVPPRLLRLWPRGGGSAEKLAAAGSAVRGAEARSPPEEAPMKGEVEAGEAGQGNWVLQMLRVQPRWAEAADAEATGGGDREPEQEDDREDGVDECASCGGEEGCAVGYDDADDGEVFDRASFSRLLKKVPLAEVKEYSKMSYLCNIAYMIPKIQVGPSEATAIHLRVNCTSRISYPCLLSAN